VARGKEEKRQLAPSPDSARLDGLREIGNAGDLSLVSSLIFLGEKPPRAGKEDHSSFRRFWGKGDRDSWRR